MAQDKNLLTSCLAKIRLFSYPLTGRKQRDKAGKVIHIQLLGGERDKGEEVEIEMVCMLVLASCAPYLPYWKESSDTKQCNPK